MKFVSLTDEKAWRAAHPAMCSLYPDLSEDDWVGRVRELSQERYTLFGLEVEGEIVTVAGVQHLELLTVGKVLWLFDMATADSWRGRGYGKEMLKHLELYAQGNGYTRLLLHTSMKREETISFYRRYFGEPFGYVFRSVTEGESTG